MTIISSLQSPLTILQTTTTAADYLVYCCVYTGEFLEALVECASATLSTLPAIGGISSGGLDALKQLGQLDFSDLTALRGQFQVLQPAN
jgi:hypothetical protein